MAKQVSLKATLRPGIGRQHARRTRAAAMIPAVVYGSHLKPIPIQVEARAVDRVFKHATSENMLVELSLDEGGQTTNRLAFIQEIQHHPLSDQVLHLDFHEVRADEKLHAHVVIVAVGEAEGVRTSGGVLEHVLHELDVECLPKDLPDRIEVDVSALQIGSNIHVSHIKAPPGVTILSHADVPVFTVLAPTKEEVVVASTELTEPEVIKQKKAEEGEEAGAKTEGKAGAKTEGKAGAKPADGKAAETKGADAKAGAKASDAKAAAKPAGKPAAKSEKK